MQSGGTGFTPPPVIRVFPLSGVILLPRGELPLNIFEPRYLTMVLDAMGGDRLIGMVQPRIVGGDDPPPLFDVGGLGRITHFAETGDGRFLIRLTGTCRFRVKAELDVETPYRQIIPDPDAYGKDAASPDPLMPIRRAALENITQTYLAQMGMPADLQAIARADDESLVNTLASSCPFLPSERQALLEAESLADRADLLMALMALSDEGGEQTLQ